MGERERRIRDEAYRLWEGAGRPEGDGREHWFEAEKRFGADDGPLDEASRAPATKRGKSAPVVAKNAGNGAVATPVSTPKAAAAKKPPAAPPTPLKGEPVDVAPARAPKKPKIPARPSKG